MSGGPVAIVDCGTNTIRLLIAESDGHGGLHERDRRMEIVRLGQGVDATGSFQPVALQRTFDATERYASVIAAHGIDTRRVRFVATSASRDVTNRQAFFDGVRTRLGVTPQVITGDDEARLSFAGALSVAENLSGAVEPTGPVLVSDIGGGSTELISGTAAGAPERAISLDIGSVRITERVWTADPPTENDVEQAIRMIDGLLETSGIAFADIRTWIGVAGTLTTLAAVDLDLAEYDRSRVHGHRIPVSGVLDLAVELSDLTSDQIRGRNGVHPQRADVITAGALIAARIAIRLPVAELIVSESDILDGAALALLQES